MTQAPPRDGSRVPLWWLVLFLLAVFALGALTIQAVGGDLIAGLLLAR